MRNISNEPKKKIGNEKKLVVVREIEGAAAVENYIMACWRNRADNDEIANSSLLNEFSRKIFGIVFADANLEMNPELRKMLDTPEKEEEWEELREAFDLQFKTNDTTPEEAVKILLKLGVDFRSAERYPLNMTRYLKRQAEAAARGIMGKLPDPEELQIERWAANLLA